MSRSQVSVEGCSGAVMRVGARISHLPRARQAKWEASRREVRLACRRALSFPWRVPGVWRAHRCRPPWTKGRVQVDEQEPSCR